MTRIGRSLKRGMDVVLGGWLLVVFFPLQVLVAATVFFSLGAPVRFIQERAGRGGRPFRLIKFRTMKESRPGRPPLEDAERLTRVGRWLRRFSLDELPQFWNVLRGEMSLVGPRPLSTGYLPLYSIEQMRRHEVKPGLTGWAQVNGRNAVSWEERFKLDVWYVDHQSCWLDVKILGLTVIRVLGGGGVNQPGRATMERFTGNSGTNRCTF